MPVNVASEEIQTCSDDVSREPQTALATTMLDQPQVLEKAIKTVESQIEPSREQTEEAAIKAWLVSEELVEKSEELKEVVESKKPPEIIEQSKEKPLEIIESKVKESEAPALELLPATSVHESPKKEVEQELNTEKPEELTEDLVTSSSEGQTETKEEPVEKIISEPEPSTSTEVDINVDKRKSLYSDPLDKTSFFPQPDDGVEVDVLNKTNLYEISEEPKTLPRKLRSRAQSFDQKPSALDSPLVKRSLRATSVPKSSESQDAQSTPRKSRRISVDTRPLEHIEEDMPLEINSTPKRLSVATATNSGTPSMLTRSATRRLSTEVVQEPR